LLAWLRPAKSVQDQEKRDQIDFEHESDKTSAFVAPPTLQGQKFWDP
jgi:hypothetical protein